VKDLTLPPRFERTLVHVMLAGVWLSAGLLSCGLALRLVLERSSEGDALLQAGLLTLMGTPVIRVVMSVGEAMRERDWFWMWSTIAVILVLAGTVWYSLSTT
jgi:uncharacterized membrane protein